MSHNWIRPPDSRVLKASVEGASVLMYHAVINLPQMHKLFFVIVLANFAPGYHRSELNNTLLGQSSRRFSTAVLHLQNDTCTCAVSAQQHAAAMYNAGKQHHLPCVHRRASGSPAEGTRNAVRPSGTGHVGSDLGRSRWAAGL